jgi:chromatin segregation and condensation protein Rec8/ScpA/Scc1 (kleisin family)
MQLIERETAGGLSVSLLSLVQGAASRLEIIVTLLALLEMVKQLRVVMQQQGAFGDILIRKREGGKQQEAVRNAVGGFG